MKKTTLGMVSLFAVWAFILAWCTNNEEVVNEAKEFCLNNGWVHEVQHSETAAYGVCILPDGTECDEWEYLEWTCPNNDEQVEEKKLTIEDLDRLDETQFPKGYTYTRSNSEDESLAISWEFTYPEDFSHTLLIPEHATMASREVISSWIEDWMIYTLTNVTLQDGTVIEVLYINNPETLDYVAAGVQNWTENANYQFIY